MGATPLERRQADLFLQDLLGQPQARVPTRPPAVRDAESESWESEPEFAEQAADQGWCCKRQTIPAIARVEDLHWTRPNGTKFLENAASHLPLLVRYWMATGQGAAAAANSAARSAADDPDFPWSAAFICFVMRAAGVVPADGFDFGSAHMTYIVGALRNRERSDQNRRFWLSDHVEIQREAIAEPGDLICFNRPNLQGVMSAHRYSTLRNQFWGNNGQHQNVAPTGRSHCALVVGRAQVGNQRFLETIGGNETNSVRLERNVAIDQRGGITNPLAHAHPGPIFGMIKIMRC